MCSVVGTGTASSEGTLVTDEDQDYRGVAATRESSDEVNENTSGRKHLSSSMQKDFLARCYVLGRRLLGALHGLRVR
jgi:hypothetical protein